MNRRTFLSGLSLLFLLSGPSFSGNLDPEFVATLSDLGPDAFASGIVVLGERLDVRAVEGELAARGLRSRWRRHEWVVRRAQELARRTQSDLLAWLEAERATGRVRSYRPFWIVNAVAVEATPAVFDALALRPEVETIYADKPLELREGWDDPGPVPSPRGLTPNQECINVQPAWDRGFTGAGRLVCLFDTGADGNHEALADKWRGNEPGVPWWAAWHDPYTNSQFPWDSSTHGTHVLGIMVATPPGQDPIGIAYEAQWIAAGILIGYNVQHIIAAYEWAADPDGDPGTIADVPDVVNNSWGTSDDCAPTYWEAIDVVEAAGVVNTIAVDNTGPSPASVNSPESRAETPYKNFGVGNVNPHLSGCPITASSGRGPSPCDMVSIKPEVTAPGTQIYSTLPNDGYGNKTGTSMACPHVSAAVAILRQANPDLTVDEVKQFLMETARDQGDAGEDNTYGWGVIDVGAALEAVLTQTLRLMPPRNLTAEFAPPADVALAWDPPLMGIPGPSLQAYLVYRTEVGSAFPETPLDSLPPHETSYVDPGVPEGSYHYAVTALYAEGESGPSNVVRVDVPAPAAAEGPHLETRRPGLLVFPQPIVSGGWIRYRLEAPGPAVLELWDVAGRRRWRRELEGSHGRIPWPRWDDAGRPLPAGVYFLRLRSGQETYEARLVRLR
jgi:bacillopeptidase F